MRYLTLIVVLGCAKKSGPGATLAPDLSSVPQMGHVITITGTEADLVTGQLIVRGSGFDEATQFTLGPTVLTVTALSATEVHVTLPVALVPATLTLKAFTTDAEASRDLIFIKGTRGATGDTLPPSGAIVVTDSAIDLTQADDSADALTIVSAGPAVAATGSVAPALDANNTGTGFSLRVQGGVDLSQARLRLPVYVRVVRDTTDGGLGSTAAGQVPVDMLPNEITPGVAYCAAGDVPISGGCVCSPKASGASSCGIVVSEPVVTPLSTGHMGWKCRATDTAHSTTSCLVTSQVMCLKVH